MQSATITVKAMFGWFVMVVLQAGIGLDCAEEIV